MLTKKVCHFVECKTELLKLFHTDLLDLKQTISKGIKIYFVTFIDDFSRYTKVYLIKHKVGPLIYFLTYKARVEKSIEKEN